MRSYQLRWIQKRRKAWLDKNGPCRKCGSDLNLEVDHINPNEKVTHRVWNWPEERRNSELSKCQVLCEKCHKQKTSQENSDRLKGIPNIASIKHSEDKFLKVLDLLKEGLSERDACKKVGIPRGTFSGAKSRKERIWLAR